ncbi:YicC/YloC family endoribonuclease [Bacillus cihuensis]|uniref:YicC/YloC family endoribonuclease n=1 Tax=Bacillus cihuensis TaxID=1208599 RepID=UPI000409F9B7|nr:YicC/YloC family endoribonuclease [Bacillus cihuensis]
MVVSMTGYGRGKAEQDKIKVTVEMKTVNHRFCEFVIRLPRQLLVLEDKLKKKASECIRRGRAEIFITVIGEGLVSKKLMVDWELTNQFFSLMNQMKEKYQLDTSVTLHEVLQLEELLSVEEEPTENKDMETVLFAAFMEALENLKEMRLQEGIELYNDLQEQLGKFQVVVDELKQYAPSVSYQYRERLAQKLNDFTNGLVEESRLLTEVAIFADKADINEELTRLESHKIQFLNALEHKEPIGRKLDFLVQEMNREVNTIGSKANDSTITKNVVEMKSLLEKMKEQVQNIE